MTAPLAVAIVGCAHRPHAWSYARALSASGSARLSAVFDEDESLGRSVADDFSAPYTDDLDTLLDSAGLDAVVVCSPTSQHRRHVEAAAAAGCHVLSEKPLATTVEDGRAIVTACRRGSSWAGAPAAATRRAPCP